MPSSIEVDASRVGGKASVLLDLQRAGFRVPPFEVSPSDCAAAVSRIGFPIAARSSATVEDGGKTSFAGQFESVLNLRTLADVEDAIARVRSSIYADSVREYCAKHGIDHTTVRMEVIVQRMIEPELAGVAFTVNPVTGAEEVVIEAVPGLADELLSGTRTSLPRGHPLLERWRPEIEHVAREIMRHFGAPQDIEFAVANGVVWILQARPITRITFAPKVGEWTNADFRDGGVSSSVCTPLMWSLYDFIWEDAIKDWFRELKLLDSDFQAGRMFFGRPYWNLGAIKRIFKKLPGFVEREFDLDLSVEITYEGDGIRTPTTLWRILKAIPTALAIPRFWKQQETFDVKFLAGGYDALVLEYPINPTDPDRQFQDLIRKAYKLTETQYFRTIFAASLAKMDFKDAFPEADYAALVAALPEMRHLAPIRDVRAMHKTGRIDVDALIQKYPYHSRRELDIRAPRWDEDREFVDQFARDFAGSAGNDPREAYLSARAEMLAKIPKRKHAAFDKKLNRLRRFVWLREEMRDLSSRMYWLIRRYVLEIARKRGLGDDIFFMTIHEIFANDTSHVAKARATFESYRNFKAPNEIGARYAYGSRGVRTAPTSGRPRFTGIGASRGTARGIARIARCVEEAARIEKGAILICPFTDPGWTPILDRCAAVVTETGGLLSHAAVICREYGIPAVLGVSGALDLIRDGQQVTVDGGQGAVWVEGT